MLDSASNNRNAVEPVEHPLAKRLVLTGAKTLVTANIWTGCPVLVLWIGSMVTGGGDITPEAVVVMVALLAALLVPMVALLGWLHTTYNALVRTPAIGAGHHHRTDREAETLGGHAGKAERLERIVGGGLYAVMAVVLFWLVFYVGPIEYR